MPHTISITDLPPFVPDFSGTQSAAILAEADRLDDDQLNDDVRSRLWAVRAVAQVASDPTAATAAARFAHKYAKYASDDASRGYALLARCFVDLSPDTVPRRHHWAQQVIDIAIELNDAQLAEYAYFLLLGTATERADIPALDHALSSKSKVVKAFPELRDGRHAAWFRCMRATLDGRMASATQLADEGHALASAIGDPDAAMVWAGQMAVIRWLQGDDDEIEPFLQEARQAYPGEQVWAAALARLWLRQNRHEAAWGVLDSLPDLDTLEHDRNWLATMAILAEVAAEIGPHDLVVQLRDILAPFSSQLVTIGLGVTAWGTVTQALALLEHRLGDPASAESHLHEALRLSSRLSSQTWLAQVQCDLATLLHQRGDDYGAATLASQSAVTARLLGMRPVRDRAQRLLSSLDASAKRATTRADLPAGDHTLPTIRVLGDFSVVGADGTRAHWRSTKAKELLGILIARRGAALSRERLLDLLWPDVAPHLLRNRAAVALSTVRRALDPQRQYERNRFVFLDATIVRLETDRATIDSENFLRAAEATLHLAREQRTRRNADHDTCFAQLRTLVSNWSGPAFPSYVDDEWAQSYRAVVHSYFAACAHELATFAAERGDSLLRVDTYRSLVETDPYDRKAHRGLIEALEAMGADRQAELARAEAAELHIDVTGPSEAAQG